MSDFITEQSFTAQNQLGALPRVPVLVCREAVSGYTPDPITGLIKINQSDVPGFTTTNSTAYGFINALNVYVNQTALYPFVYLLSVPTGVTNAIIDKANTNKRAWSFLIYCSQYQGGGTGAPGGESANWIADVLTMGTWATDTKKKIVLATWSVDEGTPPITLPAELQLGGSIGVLTNCKVCVSNSKSNLGTTMSPIWAYDNIMIAVTTFCINSAISRSWGSLSDAHDFPYIKPDTYSEQSRSLIINNSLTQYNGDRDQAGAAFMYDTFMNDRNNPPQTFQIEALLAKYYILDYVYVQFHNQTQAPGQTGLPNDDSGISTGYGIINQALHDCGDLNLILKKGNAYDYTLSKLTEEQVSQLSPDWQRTGVWPAGVYKAKVNVFKAGHYVTLAFDFT